MLGIPNAFAREASGGALEAQEMDAGYNAAQVLRGVTIELDRGSVTAICGPNGSGKSTLLRTLARQHRPTSGAVLLDGEDLAQRNPRELAKQLSFLPQDPLVPTGVTVREVVEQGRFPHRRLLGGPQPDDRDAVTWALDATQLGDYAAREVTQLSGGERQRVWIAMALAQQTQVLLLDEPTTFLDIRFQLEVLELLRQLADEHGITVAAVLHDLNQAAASADRIVLLRAGRLIASGPPSEVMTAANVEDVFDVRVAFVDDPETGRPTCLLRRATTTTSTAST